MNKEAERKLDLLWAKVVASGWSIFDKRWRRVPDSWFKIEEPGLEGEGI